MKPVSSFRTYCPVDVSPAGRELFRLGVKACMKKFVEAERKHTWRDTFLRATEKQIQDAFREHVAKGDPRDVAIFCLIMIFRGWSIK